MNAPNPLLNDFTIVTVVNGQTFHEDDVRSLRNACYDHPVSDKEWYICGPNWCSVDGIQWLLAHQRKLNI